MEDDCPSGGFCDLRGFYFANNPTIDVILYAESIPDRYPCRKILKTYKIAKHYDKNSSKSWKMRLGRDFLNILKVLLLFSNFFDRSTAYLHVKYFIYYNYNYLYLAIRICAVKSS